MLTTDADNAITYTSNLSTLPDDNNEISLNYKGVPVDFIDAATYYNISTVYYLTAGSCNFNYDGVTLLSLDQIVVDTQFYVCDSVIDYITAEGIISTAVEERWTYHNTRNITVWINYPQLQKT